MCAWAGWGQESVGEGKTVVFEKYHKLTKMDGILKFSREPNHARLDSLYTKMETEFSLEVSSQGCLHPSSRLIET